MAGALVVMLLFLAFLVAGLSISAACPDMFGRLVAGGCTILVVFQAFLNMGCVIGVFPTTGKPLPFISQGGSSMIATLWMVGLILAVAHAQGNTSIYDKRRENLRLVMYDVPRPAGAARR